MVGIKLLADDFPLMDELPRSNSVWVFAVVASLSLRVWDALLVPILVPKPLYNDDRAFCRVKSSFPLESCRPRSASLF
jgi:hypothetical protein